MFNIIYNKYVVKIDFIVRKNASYRQTEFKRRKRVNFHGVTIWMVALEDLIISKLCWAKEGSSELQKGDVKNLLDSKSEMDHEYLQKWMAELELEDIYQEVITYA